ncbi:MAG: SIMPL domain-containing protein [Gemmatimonadota bacterium]
MKKLVCLALLLMPAGLAAQQPEETQRTLHVNSTGSVEREPEQGVVLLAVESEAVGAQQAAEANATKMAELMAALRAAGVPDRQIRTVSYELRPEYSQQVDNREPPRITSYRATNMVQVTVDSVSRMGSIIDAAISNGANRVASISFQLRDYRAAHLEAVGNAVRNARREAEIVAEAAGERLGPAVTISTGGYAPPQPPMPMRSYSMDAMQGAAAPTSIEGGTLTVTAHVSIVYSLLD